LKEAFDETFVADGLDPLDGALHTFDWGMLYRRLAKDVSNGGMDKQLAEVVTRLLQILIPFRQGRIQPVSIGLNIIALAWVLNPAYFDGSPSLRDLARRCGIQPSTLARHTGHYSRFIGWRNRGQRHAWNWQAEEVPATSDAEPPAEPEKAVASITIEQADISP
jgi:hypothetical protein